MAWEPAEQVAKNAQGQFMAYRNGQWSPVAQAAKNAEGKFMVMTDDAASPAAPAAPESASAQADSAPPTDANTSAWTPAESRSLINSIPGQSAQIVAQARNSPGEKIMPQTDWERALNSGANAMMGFPVIGGGAALGLRALGKAPMVIGEGASMATRAAPYARTVLQSIVPKTGKQLVTMGAGAGAAGVGGNAARQQVENAGGGPLPQAIAEVGGGMATAAPGMIVQNAGRALANIPRKMIRDRMESSYGQEGAQLAKDTGIPLTPAAESGSKALQFAENTARNSWLTADKVLEADRKSAQAAIDRVKELANKINADGLGDRATGESLQAATQAAVKNLDALRAKQGDIDYGKVRQLAGDKPIISYTNTVQALKDLVKTYENVAGSDADKITAQAKRMLEKMTETAAAPKETGNFWTRSGAIPPKPEVKPRVADVEEARRTRSYWSRAARGAGDVFEDVSRDANRNAAGKLAAAIAQDFEAASTGQTPIAKALRDANTRFSQMSKSIDYVENSALGKMVGVDLADAGVTGAVGNTVAGEKVAERLLKLKPSEAEHVANILNTHNPQVLAQAKSFVLRNALEEGMKVPISAGANTLPISYNKMIRNMPDEAYMKALGFTPREMKEIGDVVKAMHRAGDRSGANTSGTEYTRQGFGMIENLLRGARGAASTVAQATVLNKVANAMLTDEGRQALLTISRYDPSKGMDKEIQRAVSIVNGAAIDEARGNDRK